MTISATADYALRAVLVLARAGCGRRADQIADATGAPRNYMAKTLNALAKAGIVESARGPLGGFRLALPAGAITLSRIVDLFDEARPQTCCMLGNAPCDPARPCAAHHTWTRIVAARRAPLATTTVADLLAGPDVRAASTVAPALSTFATV